ncbi:MAG: amidohydrolase family protein, partial [Gammaproteobacteria bacterium]
RARKIAGFKNALRFHKMFVDAGGHLVPGANTNPSRIPGENLHHEIAVFVEAGVTPMQIIQGATKWSAEMLLMGDDLGTVEAGKIADIIVVDADPLEDIRNLREINSVIFNGGRVELGYDPAFEDPFHRSSEMNPPVEALQWVAAFKQVAFNARGFRFTGRPPGGPGTPLPDPVESPQPAVEAINPIMVTQGDPTVTVTLTGFHFVKRSRVYFEGTSVPYRAISPTELEVTIDASLLHEAGWRDLVVVNPPPYNPEIGTPWGNGTSNKAHLIVDYRYD